MGGQLKHTFTVVQGRRAFTSQHIGDLDGPETLEHFLETLRQYRLLFRVEPVAAACDLHPDYVSSRLAAELRLSRLIRVQHHHAHAAAVLAEHGHRGEAVAVTFDGTGYGPDGSIWGGEILVADLTGFRRAGHLRYAPLPGGDLAARQPWRSALAYLSLDPAAEHAFRRAFVTVDPRELNLARQQIEHRLNAPPASSMGRLFDAAAAVLEVRRRSAYEGQAAMELEALAGRRRADPLPFPAAAGPDEWIMDPVPLLAALGERRSAGHSPEDLAAAFHESVAATTAQVAARTAEAAGLGAVVLGGGVFQNLRLYLSVRHRLEARGLSVLAARALPPNDGGLSFGQAAVAAAILRREMGA
jgi:hydrogenase maturation protein HypF